MPPLHRHADFLNDSSEQLKVAAADKPVVIQKVSSSTTSNKNKETNKKNNSSIPIKAVCFGYIQIRDYNRVVGDHPDVKVGPPISIGWDYEERNVVSVDDHEESRKSTRMSVPRRLSSITRKNMLVNVFGISEAEILEAEKQVLAANKARQRSKRSLKLGFKVKRVLLGEALMKGLAAAAGAMTMPGLGGAMSMSNPLAVY